MKELLLELQPYIVGIITTLLFYIGRQIQVTVKTYTTEKERETMLRVIKASVKFVEQVSGETLLSEDKFELAFNQAKRALENVGIEIQDRDLEMWIESFVHGLQD